MTEQEKQAIRDDQWATDREIKLLDELDERDREVERLNVHGIECAMEISKLDEENQRLRKALTGIQNHHPVGDYEIDYYDMRDIARQSLEQK